MSAVTIIPPGQETSAQYHASGAWGSTLISTFIKSPELSHQVITGRYHQPETAAMKFGSHFHALIDPNSRFADQHRCGPAADRRTKVWQSAEAEATAAGIELISVADWDTLHAMAESVRTNPIAASLLEGAEHEVGFRMQSPYGDYQVQCRADLLHRWSHIIDLKTTTDVDDFGKSVASYGYFRQAALYKWLISQACGELLSFTFVVVEKAPPLYRCRVFDLDDEYLSFGWQEVEAALIDIGLRTASGDWKEHQHADVLSPPSWLLRKSQAEAA